MEMREFVNEKGEVTTLTTDKALNTTTQGQPMDAPPADLAYLRYCPVAGFPAEMAVKHEDTYFVVALNRNQLMNMLELGTTLLRDFDKRPIEDVDVE
jgi:hypothetical protein